jgi:hypothetical protein
VTAKCGAESTTRLTCVGSARLGPFTCPTEYGWSGGRAIVIEGMLFMCKLISIGSMIKDKDVNIADLL